MSQKKTAGSGNQAGARTYAARRSARPAQRPSRTWIWVGLVVVLAAAAIGLFLDRRGESTPAATLPAEVSVAQAAEKRDDGAFILDVREPSEWEQVHIPDATLIPLGELAGRVDELPGDQEIVVVCRSGNRSAQGRDILKGAGFEQVTSMAGGMNEWQAQGYPTVTGP